MAFCQFLIHTLVRGMRDSKRVHGCGQSAKKKNFRQSVWHRLSSLISLFTFLTRGKRIFSFPLQIVSSPADVMLNWGVSNLYTVEHPKQDHLHFIRWKDNACTNSNLSEHFWRLNLFHSIILLKLGRKWNPFEFKIFENVPIWFDFNSGLEGSNLGIWFYWLVILLIVPSVAHLSRNT